MPILIAVVYINHDDLKCQNKTATIMKEARLETQYKKSHHPFFMPKSEYTISYQSVMEKPRMTSRRTRKLNQENQNRDKTLNIPPHHNSYTHYRSSIPPSHSNKKHNLPPTIPP
jgi:hypothetical protein